MKMLTGRLAAVFKSSQAVQSALLDATVPIRWSVSLETDWKKKKFGFHFRFHKNTSQEGEGKTKTSQSESHLMLSQC